MSARQWEAAAPTYRTTAEVTAALGMTYDRAFAGAAPTYAATRLMSEETFVVTDISDPNEWYPELEPIDGNREVEFPEEGEY